MKLESINELKRLISNLFEINFDVYAMKVNTALPFALQEIYKIDNAFTKLDCRYETLRFFRNMDRLTIYQELKIQDEQFTFATENQGNWYAKTSLHSDKVYIYNHEEIKDGSILDENIEQFLITFALLELSNNLYHFCGLYENDINEVKKQFQKIEELWINKKYLLRDTSFYLIDDEVIFDEANMTLASNNHVKISYYKSIFETYNYH
jgi:hypothetical protein